MLSFKKVSLIMYDMKIELKISIFKFILINSNLRYNKLKKTTCNISIMIRDIYFDIKKLNDLIIIMLNVINDDKDYMSYNCLEWKFDIYVKLK